MSAEVITAIGIVVSAANSIAGLFMTPPLVYVVGIAIVGFGVGAVKRLLD